MRAASARIALVCCVGAFARGAWALPVIIVDEGLEPARPIEALARAAWGEYSERFERETGVPPTTAEEPVRIRRDTRLHFNHAGRFTPGLLSVRQTTPGHVDERTAFALRHEVAHEFLWRACREAARDRLFHEAFALAVSGELRQWGNDDYQSLPSAVATLRLATGLDSPTARRALARVLVETSSAGELPSALRRRLRVCGGGGGWGDAVTPEELAAHTLPVQTAWVVMSRHSGEVVAAKGPVSQALPFGSTLKPLLVAAARMEGETLPGLSPGTTPEWACGKRPHGAMFEDEALLKSCNGWFLEWGKRSRHVASFGSFGPLLLKLGMARLPLDMTEAIGLRPTLTLSPLALASAYRVLAEARPDVLQLLRENFERGTLKSTACPQALLGWAFKTGTVRDDVGGITVGWLAGGNDDFIAVIASADRVPSSLLSELSAAVGALAPKPHAKASVQVLGLVAEELVEARCAGRGFGVSESGITALDSAWAPMGTLLRRGALYCLDGPWSVRFPGESGRAYAGVFRRDAATRSIDGRQSGGSAHRARRGSDVVFETTLGRYVAGVLDAEDAAIRGSAREALARVIAHNATVQRHGARPLCDTTHCQAFRGTLAVDAVIAASISKPVAGAAGWLLFSKGGQTPWRVARPWAAVEGLLGRGARAVTFSAGRVRWNEQSQADGHPFEAPRSMSCELLRSALALPSCPDSIEIEGPQAWFAGAGAGHGEGLDVETAKRSRQSADELLEHAYGAR